MMEPAILAGLTRGGRLRVALNHGNPVLVQRDPTNGEPCGVSPALARELSRRLGVELEFVHFDAAGQVFDAISACVWDVAFLAIDPQRAAAVDFTAPYVSIEGTCLVREASSFQSIADLDRCGIRIAVGCNAAYDLYLTRTLQHAELIRAPTSAGAMDLFLQEGLDAAAGVRQPLQNFARTRGGLRVLDSSFARIDQAMAVVKGRTAGLSYLHKFVREMKIDGFIERALRSSGQHDLLVPSKTREPYR